MYAHFPLSVFQLSDRKCIVKVLRVAWVYRTSPYVTEVFTFRIVLCCNLSTYLLGSILDTFRILIRQSILCKDGVHLYIIVTSFTQDVHHFAHKVLMIGIRPLGNLHQGTVVCLSSL